MVGDEHEDAVLRRLLERLQQRVGRLVTEQVGIEDQVHAAICLERPQVEVAAQPPGALDEDALALRLEHEEVGVSAGLDPVGVAAQGRSDAAMLNAVTVFGLTLGR